MEGDRGVPGQGPGLDEGTGQEGRKTPRFLMRVTGWRHRVLLGLQGAGGGGGGVPKGYTAGPNTRTQETAGWGFAPWLDFIQGPGAGGLVRTDSLRLTFMGQKALQRNQGPRVSLLPGCPGRFTALKQHMACVYQGVGLTHESQTCH